MSDRKFYPGDPCSFHFDRYFERKMKGEDIIVFEAKFIKQIVGTCPDKNGNHPAVTGFSGEVRMKKALRHDKGFREWSVQPMGKIEPFSITEGSPKSKKPKPFKPPQKGFYSAHVKTNLHLDIDEKGLVWLTDKTFYETKLLNQLASLNVQLGIVLDQIKSVQEEIDSLRFDEGIRSMKIQREIEEQNKMESYYDNLQEDISKDEINRMNMETDGFSDID